MGERVNVGDCRCYGELHKDDGDWVELVPVVSIDIGVAARQALSQFGEDAMGLQAALARAYLRFGIEAWSFEDDKGPVPIRHDAADWRAVVDRWLPWGKGGEEVAQEADRLYSATIFDPLVKRLSALLQPGPTDSSTSPNRSTGRKPRRPSRRSSRASTAAGRPSAAPGP